MLSNVSSKMKIYLAQFWALTALVVAQEIDWAAEQRGDYSGYETYTFTVEKQYDGWELREYASRVAVETTSMNAFSGFGPLAAYIGVGQNPQNVARSNVDMTAPVVTSNEAIPMTAPVVTSQNDESQEKIPMTAPVVTSKEIPMTAPVVTSQSQGQGIKMTAPVVTSQSQDGVRGGMEEDSSDEDEGAAIPMTAPVVTSSSINMTAPVVTSQSQEIDMTAPVTQSESTMAFILPAKYKTVEDAPIPTNPAVKLVQLPAREMACVRFAGWATDDINLEMYNMLLPQVEAAGYTQNGPWESHQFNAPWTPPMNRTNDLCIPVTKN